MKSIYAALLASAGLVALTGGAAAQSAEVRTLSETVARVVDIDYDSRRVLLEDDDGSVAVANVSPDQADFENVRKGDIVQAVTLEIQDLRFASPDETDAEATTQVVTSRDQLPARDDVNMNRQIVRIVSVTPDGTQVRYRENPDDITRSTYVTVTDQAVKDFVKTLNPGDDVAIVTREFVTISTIER